MCSSSELSEIEVNTSAKKNHHLQLQSISLATKLFHS